MFEGLFQPLHLILIVLIVLIIFGPGKLPALGEGLGKSIRAFKKALSEKDKPENESNQLSSNPETKDDKKASN
jgi:sec-independent protein translocase protein TatA